MTDRNLLNQFLKKKIMLNSYLENDSQFHQVLSLVLNIQINVFQYEKKSKKLLQSKTKLARLKV